MPKITKVTHCAPTTGPNEMKLHIKGLQRSVDALISNINQTVAGILSGRKLTIEGGNGISVTPQTQDLSEDRSWLVQLDHAQIVEYIKTLSVTDYDHDIEGPKNYFNKVFYLKNNYHLNSTKVEVNGVRQTPGQFNDYEELGSNVIKFNYPLFPGDKIIVDYIKQ